MSAYQQNVAYLRKHFGDDENLRLEAHSSEQSPNLVPIGRLQLREERHTNFPRSRFSRRAVQANNLDTAERSIPQHREDRRHFVPSLLAASLRDNLSRNRFEQRSVIPSSAVRWVDDEKGVHEDTLEAWAEERQQDHDNPTISPSARLNEAASSSSDSLLPLYSLDAPSDPPKYAAGQDSWRFRSKATDEEDMWWAEPPATNDAVVVKLPYDFMDAAPRGTGTLTYNDASGNLIAIHDLHIGTIQSRSLTLAAAFVAADAKHILHLDLLSPRTVEPFLRYLYTAEYSNAEDVPTSLLLHAELYFIAAVLEITGLKSQALMNMHHNLQYACSSPQQPVDLHDAIRFCYRHQPETSTLIENIVAYIVEKYHEHRFEQDPVFLDLHHNHRQFQIDLAKANNTRATMGEAVDAIVRLTVNNEPFERYRSCEDQDNPRVQDVVHFFHSTDAFEESAESQRAGKRPETRTRNGADNASAGTQAGSASPSTYARVPGVSNLTLALRSKTMGETSGFVSDSSDATSSDEESWKLVRPMSESEASTPTRESGFVFIRQQLSSDSESDAGPRARGRRIPHPDHGNASDAYSSDACSSDAYSSDSDWTIA